MYDDMDLRKRKAPVLSSEVHEARRLDVYNKIFIAGWLGINLSSRLDLNGWMHNICTFHLCSLPL